MHVGIGVCLPCGQSGAVPVGSRAQRRVAISKSQPMANRSDPPLSPALSAPMAGISISWMAVDPLIPKLSRRAG